MKKIVALTVLIISVLVILVGCKAEGTSVDVVKPSEPTEVVDPACSTGTTLMDIPVNENELYYPYTAGAFTVTPNEGCDMPKLYCVYAQTYSETGGPTCVIIPEK